MISFWQYDYTRPFSFFNFLFFLPSSLEKDSNHMVGIVVVKYDNTATFTYLSLSLESSPSPRRETISISGERRHFIRCSNHETKRKKKKERKRPTGQASKLATHTHTQALVKLSFGDFPIYPSHYY